MRLLAGAPYIQAYDVCKEPEIGEVGTILDSFGIKSILIVPIRHENDLLGSFSLDAIEQHREFSSEEIELLQIFAGYVGAALSNTRRLEKLTLLSQAATTLGEKIERKKHLDEIIRLATTLLNAQGGGIALFNRDRQGLDIITDSRRTLKDGAFLPYGKGMAGYLLANGLDHMKTVDYSKESYRAAIFEQNLPFGSMLQVPFYWNGEAVGVLYVDDVVGRKFYDQDVRDLQLFASYVSNIINLANLLEYREQLNNALSSLNLIGDSIEAADSIDRIVHFALFGVTAPYALNFDQASLFLFDNPEKPNFLNGYAAFGNLSAEAHATLTVQLDVDGINDHYARVKNYDQQGFLKTELHEKIIKMQIPINDENGEMVRQWLIASAEQHDEHIKTEFDRSLLPVELQELLAEDQPAALVALVSKSKQIGLLVVHNPYSKRTIEAHDREALRTFATSTAVAIDKVRLIERATMDASRLRRLFDLGNRRFDGLSSRDEIMREIVSAIMEVSGSDGASLVRIDQETKSVTSVVAAGIYVNNSDPFEDIRPNGHSMHVMKTGQPFYVTDTLHSTEDLNATVFSCNLRSVACLPTSAIDESLGVIWLGYLQPRTFEEEELVAWQLFVNHAALTYRLISDKQRLDAERNLTQRATEMVALRAEEQLHERIVRGIRSLQQAASVCLYLYDDRRACVVGAFESKERGDFHELELSPLVQETAKIILASGGAVDFFPRRADSPLLPPVTQITSSFIAPLLSEEKKLGILTVTYKNEQHFSQSQKKAIERLQAFCAQTLHNHAQLTDAAHQLIRLNTLSTISEYLNKTTSLEKLFDFVTKTIAEAFSAQNNPLAFCDLRLRVDDRLIVQAIYPPQLTGMLQPRVCGVELRKSEMKRGVTGRAFLTGETVYVKDIRSEPHYIKTLSTICSEVAVPIKIDGHSYGIINVEHEHTDAFTQDDIEMLKSIASQLASVILRIRQSDQRLAFHRVSKEIANAVTKPTETPHLLRQIYETMQPMMGTKICLVAYHVIIDGRTRREHAYPEELLDKWLNTSHEATSARERIGIIGRCVRTRQAQLVNDVTQDDDYIELNPNTRSEIAVPVYYNGELIAVLTVQSEQLDAFTAEDLELLKTFAELAVIAERNGEQYRDLTDTQKRVEGRTALALMNMISGVYQHTNKTHAITIRDRLELLESDIQEGAAGLIEHISVMNEAVRRIISQPITSHVTDMESAEAIHLSVLLRRYFNAENPPSALGSVQPHFIFEHDDAVRVRGHAEWLIQLFELIARNTKQALNTVSQPRLHIRLQINQSQERIELQFADNGNGFADDVLAQLFDKPIKKRAGERGSGVGLMMAKLIVESYGGEIDAYNDARGGGIVKMWFPIELIEHD